MHHGLPRGTILRGPCVSDSLNSQLLKGKYHFPSYSFATAGKRDLLLKKKENRECKEPGTHICYNIVSVVPSLLWQGEEIPSAGTISGEIAAKWNVPTHTATIQALLWSLPKLQWEAGLRKIREKPVKPQEGHKCTVMLWGSWVAGGGGRRHPLPH